jgi:hypothetical protein
LLLRFADATAHLGTFAIALALGFAVGVYGHVIRSRTVVMTGIVVVAAVSIYFVISGEAQTGTGLH